MRNLKQKQQRADLRKRIEDGKTAIIREAGAVQDPEGIFARMSPAERAEFARVERRGLLTNKMRGMDDDMGLFDGSDVAAAEALDDEATRRSTSRRIVEKLRALRAPNPESKEALLAKATEVADKQRAKEEKRRAEIKARRASGVAGEDPEDIEDDVAGYGGDEEGEGEEGDEGGYGGEDREDDDETLVDSMSPGERRVWEDQFLEHNRRKNEAVHFEEAGDDFELPPIDDMRSEARATAAFYTAAAGVRLDKIKGAGVSSAATQQERQQQEAKQEKAQAKQEKAQGKEGKKSGKGGKGKASAAEAPLAAFEPIVPPTMADVWTAKHKPQSKHEAGKDAMLEFSKEERSYELLAAERSEQEWARKLGITDAQMRPRSESATRGTGDRQGRFNPSDAMVSDMTVESFRYAQDFSSGMEKHVSRELTRERKAGERAEAKSLRREAVRRLEQERQVQLRVSEEVREAERMQRAAERAAREEAATDARKLDKRVFGQTPAAPKSVPKPAAEPGAVLRGTRITLPEASQGLFADAIKGGVVAPAKKPIRVVTEQILRK